MSHPEAVIEKAKKLERLLQRVEAGEVFEEVRAELGLTLKESDLPRLQSRYAAGERRYEVLINGQYGHWQTINSGMREWLYERKQADEKLTASQLAGEMEKKFGVRVAVGHINYLLRKRGMTNSVGRPERHRKSPSPSVSSENSGQVIENAGIFFPGSSQAGDEGQ